MNCFSKLILGYILSTEDKELNGSDKKHYGQEKLKDYFKMLYETMLGQQEGPRMGTFIAVYGIDKTKTLISKTVRDVSNNNSTVLNQQVINKLKHTR